MWKKRKRGGKESTGRVIQGSEMEEMMEDNEGFREMCKMRKCKTIKEEIESENRQAEFGNAWGTKSNRKELNKNML